jgi:hypothetical protein
VISSDLVTADFKVLDSPPQAGLLDQSGRFAGRYPDAGPLLLFRPITLLTRYLERKDLDVAHNRLLFLHPAFAELADTPFKVDNGFDKSSTAELQARLKPLIRKTQPYAKKIAHRGIWVEPSLLAEIKYRAKSAEGKVRHPFFKGIREDL